jgi:Na+-driven multidrug efflux pump
LRNTQLLKFTKPKFSFALFKQIAACGSPIFLNNISGRVTSILMNISLMTLGVRMLGEGGGQTAVAVYAVLMYASDLCWPLLYGIADSLSPALGYNWGAKNYGRVKKIVKCAYIGTAIIGLVSTSFLFFFPGTIASWFVNAEETRLLEISTHAIRLFCFSYLFRWFGVTTQSYFSAIEKPMQATLISVGTAFVFPVLLLGALWSFGLDGIWFNFVGVNALTSVLSALLLGRLMKEIDKREKELTAE